MTLNIGPKPGAAGQAASEGRDPRARMRAARQRLAQGKTRLFVLPGYDTDNPELGGGQVVCRYRRMGAEELQGLLIQNIDGMSIIEVEARFLAKACVEILFRDQTGLHPLVPGATTGYEVNIETGESFATFTGVEDEPSLRDQMVAAFGDNELALSDHSGEVHRWMLAGNTADGEIALGEL